MSGPKRLRGETVPYSTRPQSHRSGNTLVYPETHRIHPSILPPRSSLVTPDLSCSQPPKTLVSRPYFSSPSVLRPPARLGTRVSSHLFDSGPLLLLGVTPYSSIQGTIIGKKETVHCDLFLHSSNGFRGPGFTRYNRGLPRVEVGTVFPSGTSLTTPILPRLIVEVHPQTPPPFPTPLSSFVFCRFNTVTGRIASTPRTLTPSYLFVLWSKR